MRLVIFGDIHLYRLWFAPWRLLSKRILGHSNLLLTRRKFFRHQLLDEMVQRAIGLEPDMLLLSGDVTTTSLRGEFEDVAKALKPLADRVPTVLVPGNHDRYTFSASRSRLIDRVLSDWVPERFPGVQSLTDRWKLLSLDAAVPRFYNARGRLGPTQLAGIREAVAEMHHGQGLIVLCHYPCVVPSDVHEHDSHALKERDELRRLLEEARPRVVYIHGHIHRPWHHEPGDGSGVPFTCINAGSPCLTSDAYPEGQGFFEIELPDDPTEVLGVKHHATVADISSVGG